MIEQLIAEIFAQTGHTWSLKGGRTIVPEVDDVQKALDEAVKHLYTTEVGTRLSVGGLIIEKQTHNNYDVYVHVGSYK